MDEKQGINRGMSMRIMTKKEWMEYLENTWDAAQKEAWGQTQGEEHMKKGLFDDVPLTNPDRDKAWETFIKRKDVKAMMKGKEDFKFPLDGSYDLWCIAWEKAWREGFLEGWKEAGGKTREP